MNKRHFLLLIMALILNQIYAATLKEQAQAKVTELEKLITQADEKSLDAEREKLAVWVATQFLVFADWDEANKDKNEREFGKYSAYSSQKAAMADALPDNERTHVIELLDDAIAEINEVIAGTVVRRDVPLVDWENVSREEDEFISNGKPVFLYDYFSKSQGIETDDTDVYNDYLGNVDHPTSINNHYVDVNLNMVTWRLNELKNHPSTRVGYTMLWHKGDPTWQTTISEVDKGTCLFVSYDIDNPTMRSVWQKSLTESAKYIKDKKFTDLGYCLVNEPHWYSKAGFWTQNQGEMTSISSYTLQKFKDWLKEKYDNNVWALYASWGVGYNSFDDIEWTVPVPASLEGTPQWYDWCRFNMDRGTEWISMLDSSIRSSDADAATHCKVMSSTFMGDRHSGIDLEAITELTGYIGDDAAAHKRPNNSTAAEEWEANYAYQWKELALMYDFMESVSPNKIHINSESHFLSTSQWRDLNLQPEYVRNVYFLATVLGMDANLSWFWPRTPGGAMEDRFENGTYTENSYAGSCAQQPLVVNAYAKIMMDMNAFADEIMKLRRQKKSIRVFYSETSMINNQNQMDDYYDLYESMFFNGRPLGFATQKIIEKQDNDLWDAIVVYRTQSITDDEFNALQTYLDNGGSLIIDDGYSLTKNEYGKVRSARLSESKGKLYNMGGDATVAQMSAKVADATNYNPAVEVTESNELAQKGCMWRVAEDTDGSYLVSLVNLGKNATDISLKMRGGVAITSATDMMTGKALGNSFSLDSEGLLLLKVVGEASGIKDVFADVSIELISTSAGLDIRGAQGKVVTIYDIGGRQVINRKLASNSESINLDPGVVLVNVESVGTMKALVK